MKEKPPKKRLSRAEIFVENVLAQMKKRPGDCNLFDNSVLGFDIDNAALVFSGVSGGSPKLAKDTLQALEEIHKPHCGDFSAHETFSNIRGIYQS
ncbi:MAG: hypothetical protein WC741_03410 [Patescibacteria group bacterium]